MDSQNPASALTGAGCCLNLSSVGLCLFPVTSRFGARLSEEQ